MCGRLPTLVSLHSCGHLLPATLTSACVLLPVAWEVAFITCWLHSGDVDMVVLAICQSIFRGSIKEKIKDSGLLKQDFYGNKSSFFS